tara:strand:+ start:3437 stop:3928 length:492 start_codon:yes stop_codon:yes gene_type:complete
MQANGLSKRNFNELFGLRVQTIKVPDQTIFTTDVKGPGGFSYQSPYEYELTKEFSFNLLNDQFDRLRNVFVDWMRVTSGIGSDGAITYRSQTSCDLSIIALNDNGRPLAGYTIFDCIPKSVSGTGFDTSSQELVTFDVGLSCRRMKKLTGVEAAVAFSTFSIF